MDIAIIGAGMAGLTCARRLTDSGHNVEVFDKGRGPGGRMSSRRAEANGHTLRFDHGAQFFTAHDERFRRQVETWHTDGVVAPWPAAKDGAWVGTPAMNAPIRAMATAANVAFGTHVETVRAVGTGWKLVGPDVPRTIFDAVISAVPAEQASPLLAGSAPDMAALAGQTASDPCWTMMVTFRDRPDLPDTLRGAGAIGWAARDSSKPGRGSEECWVVQASADWSRQHLELHAAPIMTLLLDQLRKEAGGSLPRVRHVDAHRWRYAMCGNAGEGALWDASRHIGACGDWLLGPRVENAFLSGWELAQRVIDGA